MIVHAGLRQYFPRSIVDAVVAGVTSTRRRLRRLGAAPHRRGYRKGLTACEEHLKRLRAVLLVIVLGSAFTAKMWSGAA